MADESKLQTVLENLNAEDLDRFQTHLVQGVVDNFPAVPECKLQDAGVQETVSQMVQVYGVKGAVKICETALKIMNHSYLAETLAGIKGYPRPGFPYEQVLHDGLSNQTVITIHGQVKPNAYRFQINLHKDNDNAFHFNPRFNEDGKQVIVRNSKINYAWGAEEREQPFFPFAPGKPFEVKIFCTDSEFIVEVDRQHMLNYTHRIQEINQIRKLAIKGDVFIKRVTIDPIPLWMTAPSAYVLSDVISENMTITIPVHVKPNAKVFAIDVEKDNDIFFHLKPYFSDDGKLWIVRNSLIDGVWGPEERETPYFPFARGKSFLVKILCTDKEFKVYVGGTHLLDYKYRGFDITKINKVVICEDVIAWGVRVQPSRTC